MSSPNLEAAACLQIRDSADTVQVSVTTSVATEELPQVFRGRFARIINTGSEAAYFSAGTGCADPAAADGFPIAAGEKEDVFIPAGSGTYTLKHIGAGATTLKILLTS